MVGRTGPHLFSRFIVRPVMILLLRGDCISQPRGRVTWERFDRWNMFNKMNIQKYIITIRNEMVDEIKRLSDDEILKGDIESMAADFAAKHQIKLPVLEEEFECSPPSLTPGNAPVTVRVEIPLEGEKDLFACYGHYAPVIYERVEVFHDRLALSAGLRQDGVPAHGQGRTGGPVLVGQRVQQERLFPEERAERLHNE
jgi:hypothetical protein